MRSVFPILCFILLSLALPAPPVLATLVTVNGQPYNVEAVAGSGPDTALLELDFGTKTAPQPHLMAFAWDPAVLPSPSGRTMLSALEAGHFGLSFTDTYYASFNEYLLNTIWLGASQPADNYPSSFWLYFKSPDGTSWAETSAGYDQTPVANGDYFAWAWQNIDPNFPTYPDPPLAPDHLPAAISAAPEPGTLVGLLACGAVLLMRRRR